MALREPPVWVWPVLCVGLIGLVDDLGLEIKPWFRLSMMLAIGMSSFLLEPELLPNRLFEAQQTKGVWVAPMLGILSTLLLAGFINAANISDGANGLFFRALSSVFLGLLAITGRWMVFLSPNLSFMFLACKCTYRENNARRSRRLCSRCIDRLRSF